jgi:hypothetical protein
LLLFVASLEYIISFISWLTMCKLRQSPEQSPLSTSQIP